MKKLKLYESPDGEVYVDGAVKQKVHSEQEVMTQTIDKSCDCVFLLGTKGSKTWSKVQSSW